MKKLLGFFLFFLIAETTIAQQINNQGLTVAAQQSIDGKQYKTVNNRHVPYASAAEYLSTITTTRRHIGQIGYIYNGSAIEVWQFVGGVTNDNFQKVIYGSNPAAHINIISLSDTSAGWVAADGSVDTLNFSFGTTIDTTSLSNRININYAQGVANAAAIQQRVDSARNNAGVLELRKGGVFVPQFPLPTSAGNPYVSRYLLPDSSGWVLVHANGVQDTTAYVDGAGGNGGTTIINNYYDTAQGGGGGDGLTEVALVTIEGQSNALGVGKLEDSYDLGLQDDLGERFDRVFIFNPKTFKYEKLQVFVNNQAAWDAYYAFPGFTPPSFPSFGVEIGIAHRWIMQNPTGKLFINKNTGDGRPISYFQKGTFYYDTVQTRLAASNAWLTINGYKVGESSFWVWIQGESNGGFSEAAYRTALDTLIANRRADGIILPDGITVLAKINPESSGYNAGVENAKVAYVEDNDNARLINYTNNLWDGVHLNAKGILQLGYDSYWRGFSTSRHSLDSVTITPVNPGDTSTGGSGSVPNTNLVAYWKMQEPTGNFLSSVGNYPLTRVNGTTTTTGKISNGAGFDQASMQYLTTPHASGFNATGTGFTITGWARVLGGGAANAILGKNGTSSEVEYAVFAEMGQNKIHFAMTTTGTDDFSNDIVATGPTDGTWFFFAIRYTGTQMSISINNGTPTTKSITGVYNGTGTFYVGRYENFDQYTTNGTIDEIGVWSRALTDAEITTLYNGGSGITY